ncbi:MAG: hypothetical protein IH624_05935 [Phycisphaerae bacterium]|nr:hypothetical protein [Phycisphaerae bacterium]
MNAVDKLIRDHVGTAFSDYKMLEDVPKWLAEERWKPEYLLYNEKEQRFLALDMLLSGIIPAFQYQKIVTRLLREHDNFRVVVVVFEQSYEEHPECEEFCESANIGLKVVIPEIGIQTIIRCDFEPISEKKGLTREPGWFPRSILRNVKGLKNLGFHKVIDEFVDEVSNVGDDQDKTLLLVQKAIDALLQYHPSFRGNFGQFMKLAQFERLLRVNDPQASDHVFHSFRVFLAGCPVISKFYECFSESQKKLCIMNEQGLCVEYVWFLTAIFHDIGRPKEGAQQFIVSTLDDEDVEISIVGRQDRWTRRHNIDTRRILGSLGAFVVEGNAAATWDGGTIDDEEAKELCAEWINIYDSMKSHAVISAFDFLGDLFRKAAAADERKHRPFIVTHAVPAALAILLHDWKIWPSMKSLRLMPVNAIMLPMAALLIYIDTWDNYKRRGEDPMTFVKKYIVDCKGACVTIEWGDFALLSKDEVGYKQYGKHLKNLSFRLDIKYGLVGTV